MSPGCPSPHVLLSLCDNEIEGLGKRNVGTHWHCVSSQQPLEVALPGFREEIFEEPASWSLQCHEFPGPHPRGPNFFLRTLRTGRRYASGCVSTIGSLPEPDELSMLSLDSDLVLIGVWTQRWRVAQRSDARLPRAGPANPPGPAPWPGRGCSSARSSPRRARMGLEGAEECK